MANGKVSLPTWKGNALKLNSQHPAQQNNQKPELTNKYRQGQVIEVHPFHWIDGVGVLCTTNDGLQGIIFDATIYRNVELPPVMPAMIQKKMYFCVKITKYNKLGDGKVAFEPIYNEVTKRAMHEASGDMTPYKFTINEPVVKNVTQATQAPQTPQETIVAGLKEVSAISVTGVTEAPQEPLQGIQRTNEYSDMKSFIERVLKEPLSPIAQSMLANMVDHSNMFRLFYAMQEGIDNREDQGVLLLATIKMFYDAKQ